MKNVLKERSRRWTHDGWAIRLVLPDGFRGKPWDHTMCTTRRECRELRKSLPQDLYQRTEVVKVRLKLEAV